MSNRLQFTNQLGVGEFIERGRTANAREAKNLFDDMPWKLVSAMRVTNPEGALLEIRGSKIEGFEMRYHLGREYYLAIGSPNAALCRETLGLFAQGDPAWENTTDWNPEEGGAADGEAASGSAKSAGCFGLLLAGFGLFGMFRLLPLLPWLPPLM